MTSATLDLSGLRSDELPTATWASALLTSLARSEAAGHRPVRLTEPKLETWQRFRGRLTSADLVALLFEDAAVVHKIPFDAPSLGGPLHVERLDAALTDRWLAAMSQLSLGGPSAEHVNEQARVLGLPTRLAKSDLHVVKPHHKVLELPGTGGQLAFHIVSTSKDLTLQDNFTIACSSWQELTLAGVVALELDAPHTEFVTSVEVEALRDKKHPLRQRSFDFVVGLHPDKGGRLHVEDELAIWFPSAKALLV